MSNLPNELPLCDLTIPGTHDSAAVHHYAGSGMSTTQNMGIENQLSHGIRFLDLRVKILHGGRGLGMYHGLDLITDYHEPPNTTNQLYYKTVIESCVKFLQAHPREGIIISLKSEGDEKFGGMTIEDWFRKIAEEVAATDDRPWEQRWYCGSLANATVGDIRGKLVLWRRFPREGSDPAIDYSSPFGLNLTGMNADFDNTDGAAWSPDGASVYVQDRYSGTDVLDKFKAWVKTQDHAYASAMNDDPSHHHPQFINFGSIGASMGANPIDHAKAMNEALETILTAMLSGEDHHGKALTSRSHRSGIGVVPLDFPSEELIRLLVRLNYEWSYRISQWENMNVYAAASRKLK